MSVVNGEGDAASETNNNNNKDQAIKLFGTTIPLSEPPISPSSYSPQTSDPDLDLTKETSGQTGRPSGLGKNTENQTVSHTNKSNLKTDLKEEEQGENNNNNDTDEEKVFKKPDKIISCPRCNSTETKFCYFNNYNVNQPRHFCKNCQRYWTAGGTMRNVPVGAGRRRNKQLASQYHQIIISSNGVQATRLATTDSSNHQLISCTESTTTTSFKPSSSENGTVLKFGPDTPLCESMENALNLRDRKIGSVYCVDNLDEPSCGSSMTSSTSRENKLPENGISEVNDQTKQNCYPVPPWAIPFSPVWNSVASIGEAAAVGGVPCPVNPNLVPYYPATMFAVPGLGPPGFPLQFVAASSWAGMPVWAAGPGNLTLIGPNGWSSPTPSTGNNCSSGNGSPTLGKHSRDVNVIDEETSEKCVLVPKTLRIDNANEAMKSPNWATLGIKPNQKGMFEGIAEGKSLSLDASHILEANPAALSRSYKLQEST